MHLLLRVRKITFKIVVDNFRQCFLISSLFPATKYTNSSKKRLKLETSSTKLLFNPSPRFQSNSKSVYFTKFLIFLLISTAFRQVFTSNFVLKHKTLERIEQECSRRRFILHIFLVFSCFFSANLHAQQTYLFWRLQNFTIFYKHFLSVTR